MRNGTPRIVGPTLIALTALLTGTAVTPGARAADWPFFRGPDYNGVSKETNWQASWPEGGPIVAWEHEAGIGVSGTVVQGNRVVTMGNKEDQDVVVCLGEDGSKNWEFSYPCIFAARMFDGGTAGTPTISGGRVYTLAYDGQLYCIDLESGGQIWKKHLADDFGGRLSQWSYSCSPLVVGDLLIVDTGGDGTSTVALHKDTGEKVWTVGKDIAGYASPIPFEDGKPAVLMFKGTHLVANALKNGRELWRVPWKNDYDVNASCPIQIGDKLFVSTGYPSGRSVLFQLTGKDPQELWRNDELKTKMSSCVERDGYVYGITEVKERLLCVSLKDGSIAWEQRGFTANGTLLIAGDHIIALTATGKVIIAKADSAGYTEVSRASVLNEVCWVNPTLANARLYCRNNVGRLVCLDLRPESY